MFWVPTTEQRWLDIVAEGVRLPSPFPIYAEDFKGGLELTKVS